MGKVTRFSVLVSFWLSLVALPLAAQEEGLRWTRNISISPEQCNEEIAAEADLGELSADPSVWEGECIRVDGFWSRYALYVDRDNSIADRFGMGDDYRKGRIGLYGGQIIHAADPGRSNYFRAIGRLETCEGLRHSFDFISGYCTYGSGAVLITSSIRLLENVGPSPDQPDQAGLTPIVAVDPQQIERPALPEQDGPENSD